MIRIARFTIFCILLSLSASSLLFAGEGEVRRYALFVGANDGGSGRVQLRYAESDAQRLSAMLQRTGGLEAQNSILLREPDSASLERSLDAISQRINTSSTARRKEFIFYYSGHSNEEGLLIGEECFDYYRLKQALKNVPADVHIAILDSCSSGSFTRLKGGLRRAPFLLDESSTAAGHAFLTSSSASEAAQESDDIGGSFFTHYLLTALSGAADTSRDSRVSLNEAYSFASEETLARTEKTIAGPQHPSYDINLSGTGDLILTDISEGTEQISFSRELEGRVSVRSSSGKLVLEMYKEKDHPVLIALPPGEYRIRISNESGLHATELTLFPGSKIGIAPGDLYELEKEKTRLRGNSEPRIDTSPFQANFLSFHQGAISGAQIGILGAHIEGPLEGVQASSIFNIAADEVRGAQLSGVFNISQGEMHGPQFAGSFSIAMADLYGPQFSGVFNICEGSVRGAQFGGVFNICAGESSRGLQSAGVFNATEKHTGVQASPLNVARSIKGVQLGVVNIAKEMDGAPIGLINIIGNGLHHLSFSMDQNAFLRCSFQMGTWFYTLLHTEIQAADPGELLGFAMGIGFEIPIGPIYLDAELYAKQFTSAGDSLGENIQLLFAEESLPIPCLRFALGKRKENGLKRSLFAGVELSLHIPDYTGYDEALMKETALTIHSRSREAEIDIYPSFFIGYRI